MEAKQLCHISQHSLAGSVSFVLSPDGESDTYGHLIAGDWEENDTIRLWTFNNLSIRGFVATPRTVAQFLNNIDVPRAELVKGALAGRIWCQRWLQYLNTHKEGL